MDHIRRNRQQKMTWESNARLGEFEVCKFNQSIVTGGLTFIGQLRAPGELV